MKYVQTLMVWTWPLAVLSSLIAYSMGQSSIRSTTVVRFGAPYYTGVFYGTCQTEVYFNGERGSACAADSTRDKSGQPLR